MALSKITYTDKETLNEQPSIADKNKVTDANMNEIKSVVNANADKMGDLTDLDTTDKSSIVNAINEIVPGITTLWSGTSSSAGEKALSDSIENYNFILIGIQAGSWSKKSELIPVSDIVYHTTAGQSNDTYDITAFQSTSVYADLQVYFKNATTLYVRTESHSGWGAPDLKYVIGIKL